MSRRCCISPKTMFEMLEISPLLGQGVEECRDKHSRCFQGRMSSRHSRLADHLWTITKSQARRDPAYSLGSLPCFLSQPQATGRNVPGHSGATVSPDLRLPPSASLSDFWLELGGRDYGQGHGACREQRERETGETLGGPPNGLSRTFGDTGPMPGAVLGAGEKFIHGSRVQTMADTWKAEQPRWRAARPAEPSARTGMF